MYEIDFKILKNSIIAASNNLSINKTIVNNLNVFPVPDGDTGTNMNMTIKSALKVARENKSESIKDFMEAFSKGSLLGARGNSGVILSQLIRGFVEAIPADCNVIGIQEITKSLVRSSEVAYNAVMKPTEGTILTVAKDMAKAAKKFPKNNKNIIEFLNFVYTEGEKSLDRTPELLPILKESGVVDAGGKGLLCLFEGVLLYLSGDESILNEDVVEISEDTNKEVSTVKGESHEIEFGYCTEFIVQLSKNNAEEVEKEFKEFFSTKGDSLIVIGSGDVVKVHFHTNNPGIALEKAVEHGFLKDIKIDNMRLQHNEFMFDKETYESNRGENTTVAEEDNYEYKNAFIAVSSGEGFDEIFRGLNVAKIITGGQTMNPSTEDILSAVETVKAENIFILPNNSNIILAAEQVKSLSNKNVYVVPTKTMPEGISAIFNGVGEDDPEIIMENIMEALEYIETGEITFAVRETLFNGSEIEEGDIIGIHKKEIISKGHDIKEVSLDLVDKMQDDESSLISIYYGMDVDEESAEEFKNELVEKYPDYDIDLTYGGQPLYYYIISIEK